MFLFRAKILDLSFDFAAGLGPLFRAKTLDLSFDFAGGLAPLFRVKTLDLSFDFAAGLRERHQRTSATRFRALNTHSLRFSPCAIKQSHKGQYLSRRSF